MAETMKRCPSMRALAAFSLGKLAAAQRTAVARHLEQCPDCTAKLANTPEDTFIAVLRAAAPQSSESAAAGSASPASPMKAGDLSLPQELQQQAKYRIVSVLGQGGMGAVYKAEHTMMERTVAIKVINRELLAHPDALPRFMAEVRAAAKLDHPNIVKAYDTDQAGGLHMLVMEYVEGDTLDKVLEEKGTLPVQQVCHYLCQAALGLQHAHDQKLAHRDIKPSNLILTRKGQVKILDFGLVKQSGDTPANRKLTRMDSYMGTADYVAPEQAMDARKADIRSDIYSLGCVAYHLLSGQPPFAADTTVQTIMGHMDTPPEPLPQRRPDVPEALWQVFARMLAKDPAERFQRPIEVVRALQPFAQGAVVPPPPPPPRDPSGSKESTVLGRKRLTDGDPRPSRIQPAAPPKEESPFDRPEPGSPSREVPEKARRKRQPGGKARSSRRGLLIAAGVGAFLLLVLLSVIVLRVETPEGTVVLEIDQAAAKVAIDGREITVRVPGEMKPIKITVLEGEHSLKVEKDGFETETRQFSYSKGKREVVKVRMIPAKPAKGTVQVQIDQRDAQVFVDGRPIDIKVKGDMQPIEIQVDEGNHTLLVKKDGFLTETREITYRKGKVEPIRISLTQQSSDYVVETDDPDFRFLVSKGGVTLEDDKTKRTYKLRVVRQDKAMGMHELEVADAETSFKMKRFTIKRGEKAALTAWFQRKLAVPVKPTPKKESEWVQLFNGKDLTGWNLVPQTANAWSVDENGILTGQKARPGGLITQRSDYTDFHLVAKVMLVRGGLAGLQFRYPKDKSGISAYHVQFAMHGGYQTGTLCRPIAPQKLLCPVQILKLVPQSPVSANRWFTLEVIAVGDHIVVKVDGQTTADVRDPPGAKSGHIVLQFDLPTGFVKFRKIEIKELPPPESVSKGFAPLSNGTKELPRVDDAWLKEVAAMPAGKQVEAVAAKLKECNPGFDGKVTHRIEGGVVMDLQFLTNNVTDISPVRALKGLRFLSCSGTFCKGQLADLSPLKDMRLTRLYCCETKVSDLSPLKDMKLDCLLCWQTQVSDLSPVKDMKLTYLNCCCTKVSDLSPLKDMKLTDLWCNTTEVSDLSPLQGMPLLHLHCDFKPERDAKTLRSLITLETINGKPAKEFWKKVEIK